ncbi:hypothetical protein COR50_15115 [Chitinophaga caeni]|uniref:Uncharacterized protein n=1 Tax=Chitinophaga caeni TaxID=2029983 RepID=A0A291QWR6_9BACT|nr:hypothetical protein [Chitinophaga caeni]ATL48385.1 hypothetical protein COR50_15115 [Chitinophaga caeni]
MANNFNSYQHDFLLATGLDWKTNIDTYIQYYQARVLDDMREQQSTKLNQLIEEVKKLQYP